MTYWLYAWVFAADSYTLLTKESVCECFHFVAESFVVVAFVNGDLLSLKVNKVKASCVTNDL